MRTGKVARIADRVRKEVGELTPQERDLAINRVNTLHARLEAFMFGFHGVSTKYLQAYLDWFQWLVAFTDGFGETDDDGLLARQLGKGLYRIRRRDCQRMTPPYMDLLAESRMTPCIRCTVGTTDKHRRRIWRAYPPRP